MRERLFFGNLSMKFRVEVLITHYILPPRYLAHKVSVRNILTNWSENSLQIANCIYNLPYFWIFQLHGVQNAESARLYLHLSREQRTNVLIR